MKQAEKMTIEEIRDAVKATLRTLYQDYVVGRSLEVFIVDDWIDNNIPEWMAERGSWGVWTEKEWRKVYEYLEMHNYIKTESIITDDETGEKETEVRVSDLLEIVNDSSQGSPNSRYAGMVNKMRSGMLPDYVVNGTESFKALAARITKTNREGIKEMERRREVHEVVLSRVLDYLNGTAVNLDKESLKVMVTAAIEQGVWVAYPNPET